MTWQEIRAQLTKFYTEDENWQNQLSNVTSKDELVQVFQKRIEEAEFLNGEPHNRFRSMLTMLKSNAVSS